MEFSESIIDTIQKRRSIRTYDVKSISESHYRMITDYLNVKENLMGPLGNKVRFEIVPVKESKTGKGMKIGTYGFISNSRAYVVGIMKKDRNSLIDFGYVFERFILYLTEIGIGTCWLGGTFSRDSFEKEVDLGKDEIIPCITPIGYPRDKQRLFEKTLRFVVKADNRKPWETLFYYTDFESTLKEEDADQFRVPMEMVRLGPSASNKQPWRLVLSKDKKSCHFYLVTTPNYSGNKIGFEMQKIDMGIAMCHFQLACKDLDIKGDWELRDPNITLPNEHTQYISTWIAK